MASAPPQSWLAIGARRRSNALVSKGFALAEQAGLTMDQLLGGAAMSFLPGLLCHPSVVAGPKVELNEVLGEVEGLTPEMLEALEGGWASARVEDAGLVRFFVSRRHAEDIMPWAEVQALYERNEGSVFSRIHPQVQLPQIMHAIGLQVKHHRDCDGVPQPPTGLQTTVLVKGSPVSVTMQIAFRVLGATKGVFLFTYRENAAALPPPPPADGAVALELPDLPTPEMGDIDSVIEELFAW